MPLPELQHRVIIGIVSPSITFGTKFIYEWEQLAAKAWPQEWRRPFVIAYLGPDAQHNMAIFLADSDEMQIDCLIKLNTEPHRFITSSENFIHLLLARGDNDVADANFFPPSLVQSFRILLMQVQTIEWRNELNPAFRVLRQKRVPPNFRGAHLKVLGIMGGHGPIGSANCLKAVADAYSHHRLNTLAIFYWSNPNKPHKEWLKGLFNTDRFGLWDALDSAKTFIQRANQYCEKWIAPCNTFNAILLHHLAFQPGFESVAMKNINMIDAVTEEVARRFPGSTVGLMGATRLKNSGGYQKKFSFYPSIQLLETTHGIQAQLQSAIDLTKSGKSKQAQSIFSAIIDNFVERGARVILLACTEINLSVRKLHKVYRKRGIYLIDSNIAFANLACRQLANTKSRPRECDPVASLRTALKELLRHRSYWHHCVSEGYCKTFFRMLPEGIEALNDVVETPAASEDGFLERLGEIPGIRREQIGTNYFGNYSDHPQVSALFDTLELLNQEPIDWVGIAKNFNALLREQRRFLHERHPILPEPTPCLSVIGNLTKLI